MANTKKLGVWIDHSCAHLTEYTSGPMTTSTIESDFTFEDRTQTLARSENVMHNKEQHKSSEFFKTLGKTILNYNEVILFGPTSAKVELLNIIRRDHRFAEIKINVEQTDKMTENQEHAFIREYFSG